MAIYTKKVSIGGVFFKKGEDIKDGDIIEIANEGKQQDGQYGTQEVFLVKLSNGREGNVGFNQTTINGLIDAFEKDSLKWIGKKVKVIMVKQNVSGKFKDVYYFAHPDAELTEDGFVLPGKDSPSKEEDIPVIEEEEDNSF